MTLRELLIPAAVLGPAVAVLVWLLLVRWPWPRRVVAAVLWLGSQAAAWAVFWEAFGGEPPSWFGLTPGLLQATLAAAAGAAATLVLPRIDGLRPRAASAAVAALGVGLAAVVAAAYSTSLVALAVLVPIPTLGVGLAGVVGDRARGAPGLLGLAAADAAALAGLLILLDRSDTTTLATVADSTAGVALLLAGAALKLGAVPHVASWRAAAGEGVVAPLSIVLRSQGAVLAAVAAFTVAGVTPSAPLAAVAAALTLAAGLTTLMTATALATLSGVAGAGAATLLVALGLGGGVGARAGLFLLPVFVLAAGVVAAAGWPAPDDPHEPRAAWRWIGALALAVGAASLLGLPPAGGFPGTWLALSLAVTRGTVEPWYLVVALAVVSGLALAALAAVPAVHAARTRPTAGVLAALGSLGLVYAGAQPLRLGLGWLVRVEAELGLPEVLPSAGGPALPPIGGVELAWAVLPAAVIVAVVLVLGRGARRPAAEHEPLVTLPTLTAPGWVRRPAALARRLRLGTALAALIEAAAVAGAVWVVMRGVDLGFL